MPAKTLSISQADFRAPRFPPGPFLWLFSCALGVAASPSPNGRGPAIRQAYRIMVHDPNLQVGALAFRPCPFFIEIGSDPRGTSGRSTHHTMPHFNVRGHSEDAVSCAASWSLSQRIRPLRQREGSTRCRNNPTRDRIVCPIGPGC
jgi:hypothetical protein